MNGFRDIYDHYRQCFLYIHVFFRIIFIALILYGFSMLPFTYAISFLFKEASVGFACVSVICIITGRKSQKILDVFANLSEVNRTGIAEFKYRLNIASVSFTLNEILCNGYAISNGHNSKHQRWNMFRNIYFVQKSQYFKIEQFAKNHSRLWCSWLHNKF